MSQSCKIKHEKILCVSTDRSIFGSSVETATKLSKPPSHQAAIAASQCSYCLCCGQVSWWKMHWDSQMHLVLAAPSLLSTWDAAFSLPLPCAIDSSTRQLRLLMQGWTFFNFNSSNRATSPVLQNIWEGYCQWRLLGTTRRGREVILEENIN